jgi:hypothetical protein
MTDEIERGPSGFVPYEDYEKLMRERDAWKNEALNFHCTWMKCTYAESERIVQEYIDERLEDDRKRTESQQQVSIARRRNMAKKVAEEADGCPGCGYMFRGLQCPRCGGE